MGNSSSTAYEERPSPPSSFEIRVSSESEFETDTVDPIYALKVQDYRCKLARPSRVYLIAVRVVSDDDAAIGSSKDKIHCGLLLENTFSLTSGSGNSMEFPYVFIHSLPNGRTADIVIQFLRSEDAAFRHIEQLGFMKSERGWKRAKVGGWTSTIACSKAVSAAKAEVGREFVIRDGRPIRKMDMSNRTVELNPDVTNCTLCAVRFYCTLEETGVEQKALEVLSNILPQLGLNADMINAYKKGVSTRA